MEFDPNALMGSLGAGAVVGFVTGWAFKKAMKIVAAIMGAYTASLLWLQQKGVITIHMDRFTELMNSGMTAVQSTADQIMAALPATGGFSIGFLAGFKKG